MTEQIEDDFWAEERARDTAARGKHADPAGCDTCKASVAAGGQVKHDECAQRATLLPAPDAPGWELITGLSEEELAALPARFHIPAFIESSTPKAWVCAVCWGDGWSTQWPCKTALEQGLRVFTAEDYAETAAKRQTAALAAAQAQAAEAQVRIAELEAELGAAKERYKQGLQRADEQLREMNTELQRYAEGTETPVLWSVYNAMHLRAANAEAELKKYVGAEPTIAEEMAYVSRCLFAVHDLCDEAKRSGSLGITPEAVEQAASGEWTSTVTRPALPWAHVMDDGDLSGFLNDLVSAAIDRWRSEPDVPDRDVLANVEKVCAAWRTPGHGYRSDEPGAGEGR